MRESFFLSGNVRDFRAIGNVVRHSRCGRGKTVFPIHRSETLSRHRMQGVKIKFKKLETGEVRINAGNV
jgi:hypothetical protein